MDKQRIRFWSTAESPDAAVEPHPTYDPDTPKRPTRSFVYRSPASIAERPAIAKHPLRRRHDVRAEARRPANALTLTSGEQLLSSAITTSAPSNKPSASTATALAKTDITDPKLTPTDVHQ